VILPWSASLEERFESGVSKPLCLASVEIDTRSGEGGRMNCEKIVSSHREEPMRVLSQDRSSIGDVWSKSSSSTNQRLSPPSRGGADSVTIAGEGSVRSM
jgi:hypothetical protein